MKMTRKIHLQRWIFYEIECVHTKIGENALFDLFSLLDGEHEKEMSLVRRKATKMSDGPSSVVTRTDTSKDKPWVRARKVAFDIGFISFVLYYVVHLLSSHEEDVAAPPLIKDPNLQPKRIRLSDGVVMTVALRKKKPNDQNDNDDTFDLGPHSLFLYVDKKKCEFPRVFARFVGDALVYLHFVEDTASGAWIGTLTFPVSGYYTLQTYFYGCSSARVDENPQTNPQALNVKIIGKNDPTSRVKSLFPFSWWLNSNKTDLNPSNKYVWVDPTRTEQSLVKASDSLVVTESVATKEHGFYQVINETSVTQ